MRNFDSLVSGIYEVKDTLETEIQTAIFPTVSGTEEEAGGDGRKLSKWFNVKIEFDPSKTENNATVTISMLNSEDKLTIDNAETSSYSYTVTSSINAITQFNVHLTRGYYGAIIMDNIKMYNTSADYLPPAINDLSKAIQLYGSFDVDEYTSESVSAYTEALNHAKNVLAASNSSNAEVKAAKTNLIDAASKLNPKTISEGERLLINQDPDWIFIKERNYQSSINELSEFGPNDISLSGWESVNIPHTWNAYDGSDGVKSYDRCKSWYRKSMFVDESYKGKQLYLEFEAAAYQTQLYINGKPVVYSYDDPFLTCDENGIEYVHRGGYSTFRFDITDYVNYGEANTVSVAVDSTESLETLPLGGDFSKQGGIYRDVTLVVTNPVHIDMLDHGSTGVYFTPQKATSIDGDKNKDFNLTANAKVVNDSNAAKNVRIEAELREPDHFDVPDNEYIKEHLRFNPESMYTPGGRVVKSFEVESVAIPAGKSYDYNKTIYVEAPRLWDGLDDPYMYDVHVKVYVDDVLMEDVSDTVGFRYFKVPTPSSQNDNGGFYLNGRPYRLDGVGKHQDWGHAEDALGVAVTDKERLSDAGIMYELGNTSIRLVHYQHSRREIELYDKLGIIVWSEPALCSSMIYKGADVYPSFEKTTLYQFTAMIKQQYNNPSLAFWAFSNEISHIRDDRGDSVESKFSFQESLVPLFEKMQARAKELDPVRITTYATNSLRSPEPATDTTGVNRYPYWYVTDSASSVMRNTFKNVKANNGNIAKPIALTEYGAAAVAGVTQEYNEDGTVPFLGTSESKITSNTTYQAYAHEKIWSEISPLGGTWSSYVWQMFDSANDAVDVNLGGMNTKGLVSYDHKTKKAAYYFYKANWNDFEPFVYIVNTERSERPAMKTIIRAYSNSEQCQLYINGTAYGSPVTDTNPNDKVSDGVHVFMWYDVPLSVRDVIEIKGIENGDEVSSSVETNGEVIFTTESTSTSIKSNDESKLMVNGDVLELLGGIDTVSISSIINGELLTVLNESVISITDSDGAQVTAGSLLEGMIIRVTAENGEFKDYNVVTKDIAQNKTVTASSNQAAASNISDGDTNTLWMAETANEGEYVIVDLGREYNLNQLDIYLGSVSSYKVQISSDGTKFTDEADHSSNNQTAVTDTFTGKAARYVKIIFGSCSKAPSIREIEVYGWAFVNNGNYYIDEAKKVIYLGETSTEHDMGEVYTNLFIDGQAEYVMESAAGSRVLMDGDLLIVQPVYGADYKYTINTGSKK